MADARTEPTARPKRADARRNEEALLAAASTVFVRSGVDASVREISAAAGVGMGTIYRHFPTRADLVIAVFRHQIEACAEAASQLLRECASPFEALSRWIDLFVDFLVTKHGLASALQNDTEGFERLHAHFVDRLLPPCAELLSAAVDAGEVRTDISAYELLRGVGNLSAGTSESADRPYNARQLVSVLVSGLRIA